MKKNKLLSAFLCILSLPGITSLTLSSCNMETKEIVPTDIQINQNNIAIGIDQTIELVATVIPEQAKQDVSWSSSDNEIVTVDAQGKIKGCNPGHATIITTPKGYDEIYATCDVNVAHNFNNCSWSEIINSCEKLELTGDTTKFCENFLVDNDGVLKQATSLNDFLGQERIIVLNNQPHKVRVVGCQQDFMGEGQKNPVALTFQFKNLVSNQEKIYENTSWSNDGSNKNYWESTLCNFLNNDIEDETFSVYEMIKASDNDSLAEHIKNVYRGVNVYNETLESEIKFEVKTQQTKMFCPTISNYFSQKGILRTSLELISEAARPYYYAEGQQYQYYKNEIVDEPIKYDHYFFWNTFPCLEFRDLHGNLIQNWISSPIISKDGFIWSVTENTEGSPCIGMASAHIDAYGVAPCFCL